jgi:hypothetical protein
MAHPVLGDLEIFLINFALTVAIHFITRTNQIIEYICQYRTVKTSQFSLDATTC